jgi:hypothetical protein
VARCQQSEAPDYLPPAKPPKQQIRLALIHRRPVSVTVTSAGRSFGDLRRGPAASRTNSTPCSALLIKDFGTRVRMSRPTMTTLD